LQAISAEHGQKRTDKKNYHKNILVAAW